MEGSEGMAAITRLMEAFPVIHLKALLGFASNGSEIINQHTHRDLKSAAKQSHGPHWNLIIMDLEEDGTMLPCGLANGTQNQTLCFTRLSVEASQDTVAASEKLTQRVAELSDIRKYADENC